MPCPTGLPRHESREAAGAQITRTKGRARKKRYHCPDCHGYHVIVPITKVPRRRAA